MYQIRCPKCKKFGINDNNVRSVFESVNSQYITHISYKLLYCEYCDTNYSMSDLFQVKEW